MPVAGGAAAPMISANARLAKVMRSSGSTATSPPPCFPEWSPAASSPVAAFPASRAPAAWRVRAFPELVEFVSCPLAFPLTRVRFEQPFQSLPERACPVVLARQKETQDDGASRADRGETPDACRSDAWGTSQRSSSAEQAASGRKQSSSRTVVRSRSMGIRSFQITALA